MFSAGRASAQDSWATRTSDPNPQVSVASGEIGGLIYVYGYDATSPLLSIYNPTTDSWTTGAAPSLNRAYVSAGIIQRQRRLPPRQRRLPRPARRRLQPSHQ